MVSAFAGTRRKLVLAFDVGTTYSGISYSILDPGLVPEIKGVTKFPAHDHISGSSKIPTIIYYDRAGKVRAIGAEAMTDGIFEMAEEEHWVKAEWFKLHLRSKFGGGKHINMDIPPLPLNKTVVEVFADFLKYLLECASSYIQATHANGADLWKSVKGEIEFVLSHPNGWEGTEQSQMRKAATLAGLIRDNVQGNNRLTFVTEGEASLHFAIMNGLPEGAMKREEGVVIIDAGGGTVDVSSYCRSSQASNSKATFEEIAAPQCYFLGSVFVTIHARHFLDKFLSKSSFVTDVDHIARSFDKTTKLRFKDAEDPQYVKFGSTRDNDPECNIRFGQLKLLGSDVASFFQPSVDCIVNAVLAQRKSAHKPISHVILVGGFAASPWLYKKVQATLEPYGLTILVPESHVNKAVSDGAISFYLDRFVQSRVSKFTYGVRCGTTFNATDPDHLRREADSYIGYDGIKNIHGFFSVILHKNTQVLESKQFRRSYEIVYALKAGVEDKISEQISCYRGPVNPAPIWTDQDPDNYTSVCVIEADLSRLPQVAYTNKLTGKPYYKREYDIILLFGLTQLKAQIAWKENGVEKRSRAAMIYDPDTAKDTQ